MTYDVEFIIPAGDQVALELAVENYLYNEAKTKKRHLNQPWGEFFVAQGLILHGVQWSYCVEDEDEDENGPIFGEDEIPDCQIDCSWHELEEYQ